MIRIWKGFGNDWKYSGAMTKFQQLKHRSLMKDGLSAEQAREFIWYNFKEAYMRRFRANVQRGNAGNTKASAWALWRMIYDEAVEKGRQGKRGGYKPPKRKYDPNKPHKKLLPGGDVDKDHASEYERKRRAKQKKEQGSVPKGVTGVQRDADGKVIGGIRFNYKTNRFEVWKPKQ